METTTPMMNRITTSHTVLPMPRMLPLARDLKPESAATWWVTDPSSVMNSTSPRANIMPARVTMKAGILVPATIMPCTSPMTPQTTRGASRAGMNPAEEAHAASTPPRA